MKRYIILTLILVLGILAVAGFAVSPIPAIVAQAAAQPITAANPPAAVSAPRLSTISDLETAYENIYEAVNSSIVTLEVVSNSTSSGVPGLGPLGPQGAQQALGSGFVWDKQGNIVTNNHVIDGADQITVTFADGTTAPGKVVGADPDSDLAVVKVNVTASLLHPVQMGDSTQLKVGQLAVAIGNPYGEQNTLTHGIISALGRSLPVNNGQTQGPSYTIPDVIQTDTPINPGNSGGALLNMQGEVIGVTQSIESQSGASAGIGFAIPSAIVKRVVPVLITSGHFDHPYLGISGSTLTSDLAQAMKLDPGQRGALVGDVTPTGPAGKAGLKGSTQQTTINGLQANVGGDVIIAIDSKPVKTFDDIVAYLASSTQVNQTIILTVLRNGQQQAIKVTLEARPTTPAQ